MKMDKLILVYYVHITYSMSAFKVRDMIEDVKKMFALQSTDGGNYIFFIVPTTDNSRIECINPQRISDDEYVHVKEILNRNQKAVDKLFKKFDTDDKEKI